MDDKHIPSRLKTITPKRKRSGFVTCDVEQVRLLYGMSNREPKTLLVWMVLLNACRTTKSSTVRLSPRWWQEYGLTKDSLRRGLTRIREKGLIDVEFKRGRSPIVNLMPHVDYDLKRK